MEECAALFGQSLAHKLTEDGTSWVVFARGYCRSTDEEFEEAWKMRPAQPQKGRVMGMSVTFPRRQQAYGTSYAFAGQTADALDMVELPRLCADYRASMPIFKDGRHNGTLLNWYIAESGDYIGKHSDNEKGLIPTQTIASITWARPRAHFRRFRLSPKKGQRGATLTLDLYDGDLVIMGGLCQTTHDHEIMKSRKRQRDESEGRRINQTDRAFTAES